MRIARVASGDEIVYGVVAGPPEAPLAELDLAVLAGAPTRPTAMTGERLRLSDVRVLAPVLPTKVVCVGKNYADHATEMGSDVPAEPLLFLKPSTAVVGPGEHVVLPPGAGRVDHEAELAVVIGAVARSVPRERAADVVWGYTCANDVTARDLQAADGQWTRAKGFDSFCPLGPWVETSASVQDVAVRCRVDGELRQDGRTGDLVHGVADLVAYVSAVMTLLPGDVLLTGTPAGVGPLADGDEVSVEVEGVGVLTNPVVAG